MKRAHAETRVSFLTNEPMPPAESPRELSARSTTQFMPGMASKRQPARDAKRYAGLRLNYYFD